MLRDLFLLPNLITLSRILLSPLIIFTFDSSVWLYAILIYTVVSDFADGFLARRMGLRSSLGANLDPIADKILVLCFLAAAMVHSLLAPWMIGALLLRDAYISVAYPFYFLFVPQGQTIKVGARAPGKLTTGLQFLCLALLALLPLSYWKEPALLRSQTLPFLLLYPVSLWAIVDYTRHYWKVLQNVRQRAHTQHQSTTTSTNEAGTDNEANAKTPDEG